MFWLRKADYCPP